MSLKQNDKKIKVLGVLLLGLSAGVVWQIWLVEEKYNQVKDGLAFSLEIDQAIFGLVSLKKNGPTSSLESKTFYIAASKSGTKYYYANCSGLNRIKLENRVFFESEAEAEGKGLELAKGCKKP